MEFEETYNENIMAQESMINHADDIADVENGISKIGDNFDFSKIEEIPF